jgi:hypothetical protein
MTTSIIVKDHTGTDVTVDLPAGAVADAAVSDPTASGSLVALAKGKLTLLGGVTETAPASDTASSGLNGRLQRIAQNITTAIASLASILAKLPSLGTAGTPSSNVISVQGVSSGTSIIVGGPVAGGATAGGNPVLAGADFNSTLPTYTTGQRGGLQVTSRGSLRTYLTGAVSAAGDGQAAVLVIVGRDDATGGAGFLGTMSFVYNGATLDKVKKPVAASTKRLLSAAASTNGDFAKASAGDVFNINGYNAAASVRFLKLYNKASAPTVGTDTPVLTIALPPGASFSHSWPAGLYFSTGIAFALTTGAPDADTGALTAADVVGLNVVLQ